MAVNRETLDIECFVGRWLQSMIRTCFLGANSREGFVSLYRCFPGDGGAFLHILKGGPGTGKSSFMRKIGQTAEAQGLDVLYVLCSGDPDSLDGVFIPAMRLAWVDGTAPHTLEPIAFGVDADYVNLGMFCSTPFLPEDRERISELSKTYRGLYSAAYRALAQAELTENHSSPGTVPTALLDSLDTRRAQIVGPERRFLRAISCQGLVSLDSELESSGLQRVALSAAGLSALSRELERRGLPAIRCPSPLDAGRLESLLLPWANLAFTTEITYRHLEPALEKLRDAKQLHDQLEAICRPYMDFGALTDYTSDTVRELFG